MGVQHTIACHQCHTFLDTGKWPILQAYESDFPRGTDGKRTRAAEVRQGIAAAGRGGRFEEWAVRLTPSLELFLSGHDGHELRIHDDAGEHLWDPESPGYCKWKEASGYCTLELFLPRNLIDDLGIRSWPSARAHLGTLSIYLVSDLELVEYEAAFLALSSGTSRAD